MPPITYTRLRDGSWGIKAQPGIELQSGATVTVEKKSGDTRTETVGTVLSTNEKGTIARVQRGESAESSTLPATPIGPAPDSALGKAQAASNALLGAFASGEITAEVAFDIFGELLTTVAPRR